MKRAFKAFGILLVIVCVACSEEEIVRAKASDYILIGDSRQGQIFSNVAKFSATSKRVSEHLDVDFWIRDAILVDDELFAYEVSDTGRIWTINLDEMNVTNSVVIPFVDVFTTYLHEYENQIFVSGIELRNDQFLSILYIYTKELERTNEIVLGQTRYNTELLIIQDKIFISLADEAGESIVRIFDVNSFDILDEFSFGTFLTSEFQVIGNQVYAFNEFGFYLIDLTTLERTFHEEETIDIGLEKSPSIAFGETENFYYLNVIPQPSPIPFQLVEFSINENEPRILINDFEFLVNFPIEYDTTNNVVLLNGGRRLMKVTTPSGNNQINANLPFEDLLFILRR